MTDITKLDLEKSQPKFISVGSNVFVSSTGKSEVCRKGQQGLFCKRHHGSSYNSHPEVRAKLDAFSKRTEEKLSPFENGCIWLYSVLMRTSMEEARKHYIESTAMYTLLGVRKPSDIEVKGLQKALMGLIESSKIQDTRMDKLKKLVKDMAFGKGFTEAGFYTLKDMTKETLNKIKLGFAGLTLGSSLLLTGCAGIQNPINTFQSQTQQQGGVFIPKDNGGAAKLVTLEKITDDKGSYTRTKATNPNDIKYKTDPTIAKKDQTDARNFLFEFVTQEALDSIALDNASKWDDWKKNIAPKYISSKYISEILSAGSAKGGNGNATGLILTDIGNPMPTLLRDGGTRGGAKTITNFILSDSGDKNIIYASVAGTSTYYASDDAMKEYYREFFKNNLYDDYPNFNDNKAQSFSVDFQLGFTLVREGSSWKIAGFSNNYDIKIGEADAASTIIPSDRLSAN